MTFPSAAFANNVSPAQETGSDIRPTITVNPSNGVIHQNDPITLNLSVTNHGPEDAIYSENTSGAMPIAEFLVPPSVTFSVDDISKPDGIDCMSAPLSQMTTQIVSDVFPNYTLVMCTNSATTPIYTFAVDQTLEFSLTGTANTDITDGTIFLGVGLAANDPDFQTMYASLQNGENPFVTHNGLDLYNAFTYSNTIVTTTTTTTIPVNVLAETQTRSSGVASSAGNLAETGLQTATLALIAGVLIGAGILMVRVSRKKDVEI